MRKIMTQIEWTLCSEKLPEDSKDVLLWHKTEVKEDDTIMVFDETVIAMLDAKEKQFVGLDYLGRGEFPVFDYPIAWAPLPKPYED